MRSLLIPIRAALLDFLTGVRRNCSHCRGSGLSPYWAFPRGRHGTHGSGNGYTSYADGSYVYNNAFGGECIQLNTERSITHALTVSSVEGRVPHPGTVP